MEISDEKLLRLCERYGRRALLWRRKFIGLLPEVNRRHLYERRGCQSVFEFAFKTAGLTERQVREVLNLEERFQEMPTLHSLLVEGTASVSKLARVASIVSAGNEAELAEKVKQLPQRTLDTLVRDERHFKSKNGLDKPLFEAKSLCAQRLEFELSAELVERLNELHRNGLDANEIVVELLKRRGTEIQQEKDQIAEELGPTDSRRIPAKVRRILREEHGTRCSISTCAKPAQQIHHTQRFSLGHSHDPRYLAPLCREHHQLAHAVDLRVQQHWRH